MKTRQLFILLLCTIFTSYTHANTLIITRGPICSGMGSYLSNLIHSLDNSYEVLAQRDIFNMLYFQLFSDLFPKQMSIISNAISPENISYAITKYHTYFKKTAYEQQKQQTLQAIDEIREFLNKPGNEYIYDMFRLTVQHIVISNLAYHAALGHNVIFEGGTIVNWDNEIAPIKQHFT